MMGLKQRLLCTFVLAVAAGGCASGASDDGAREPGATLFGPDPGGAASAVASGDFNSDGHTDIALGAPLANGPDDGREGAGEVHIFLGPLDSGDQRDAAAGGSGLAIYGAAEGDSFGRRLAAADFSGDGIADLAISATPAGDDAGAVYIVFGGPGITGEPLDFAVNAPDVLIQGGDPGDFAGHSLAVGDFDGDANADLLIGALMADGPENARPDAGEVYVVPGADLPADGEINLGEHAAVVFGAEEGDWLGETAGAGDVDGDGSDDLVLVAAFADGPDNNRDAAGETYVVLSTRDLPLDLAKDAPYATVTGVETGDQFGHSLAVGDTDGDGEADLWIGAVSADGPENTADLAGEAALVLSSQLAPGAEIDLAAGDGTAIVYGPVAGARLGRFATAADLTGDGAAELFISAPNMLERGGAVFVLNGGGGYPDDAANAAITYAGLDPEDELGTEVYGAPPIHIVDLNGDGELDVIVTAAHADGPDNARKDCGEAYVFFGDS